MKQLTFLAPGRLGWWDVPEPRLEGPGEALVCPVAVATCDLDTAIIDGRAPYPGPFPLGHEFVAEILDVGDAVTGTEVGQLVVVAFQISCGTCPRCVRGHSGDCTTVPRYSMYGLGPVGGAWGGALSEVVRVPFADAMCVPLPAGVSPRAAASVSDNLSDAWRTVGPYVDSADPGRVLVIGGASIGLYATEIARAMGANADYNDVDPVRLAQAEAYGARVIEGPPPERLGPYAITVNTSARAEGLACALRSTEPGGICTDTGIHYAGEVPLPLLDMYMTGVTFVTGRVHARACIPAVLTLLAEGRIHPGDVTSQIVGWDESADVLARLTRKVVVSRG